MRNRRILFTVIAVVILVLTLTVSIFSNRETGESFEEASTFDRFRGRRVLQGTDSSNQIAVLDVNGIIQSSDDEDNPFTQLSSYHHQATLDELKELEKNKNLKGLILVVNSPGGTTYASIQLERALEDFKEKTNIPIYVSMKEVAASGGYMISSVGDKIFADTETTTGSIGVIMESMNYSGLMEKYGVEANVVKSGKYKDIMSPYRSMTDDEKKLLQSTLMDSYNEFVDIVAKGRKMSTDEVKKLADGRVYSGTQAVKNGLVDEIGYFDDALNALEKEEGIGSNSQVIDVTPRDDGWKAIYSFGRSLSISKMTEVQQIEKFVQSHHKPQMYFLYGGE